MGRGPSKKEKRAAEARLKETIQALNEHVREIQPFVPLSYNEQLMRYLQMTYKFGRRKLVVAHNDALKEQLLRRAPKVRMKGGFNKFRILLEMQSPTSPSKKQRQRHARALLAAHKADIHSSDFVGFVKAKGGLNKLGDAALKRGSSPKPAEPLKSTKRKNRHPDDWPDDDISPKSVSKAKPEDWD